MLTRPNASEPFQIEAIVHSCEVAGYARRGGLHERANPVPGMGGRGLGERDKKRAPAMPGPFPSRA
jgi:hypothetical protein